MEVQVPAEDVGHEQAASVVLRSPRLAATPSPASADVASPRRATRHTGVGRGGEPHPFAGPCCSALHEATVILARSASGCHGPTSPRVLSAGPGARQRRPRGSPLRRPPRRGPAPAKPTFRMLLFATLAGMPYRGTRCRAAVTLTPERPSPVPASGIRKLTAITSSTCGLVGRFLGFAPTGRQDRISSLRTSLSWPQLRDSSSVSFPSASPCSGKMEKTRAPPGAPGRRPAKARKSVRQSSLQARDWNGHVTALAGVVAELAMTV